MKKKDMKGTIRIMNKLEATRMSRPRFNPYQTGHGAWGTDKYNRNEFKRETANELKGEQ